MKTVLITGAAGNIGNKLRLHFQGRYDLRLLDIDPRGDKEIKQADLSVWSELWSDHFQGVDTVVHMAADPTANQIWDKVVGPNIDAVVNTLSASVKGGVKRVIFASSNHAMGGYKDIPNPKKITADTPPPPTARYPLGCEWKVTR